MIAIIQDLGAFYLSISFLKIQIMTEVKLGKFQESFFGFDPQEDHTIDDKSEADMLAILQSSMWVNSPHYCGWLYKKSQSRGSQLLSKTIFFKEKAWRRKWVALHGSELVYMTNKPDITNLNEIKIVKHEININTTIDCARDELQHKDVDIGKPIFSVHFANADTWYLRAENEKDKKEWIQKLTYTHAIMTVLDSFVKIKVLGVGGQGVVYDVMEKDSLLRFAMKEITIKSDSQMENAIEELHLLHNLSQGLSHPNIMTIEKSFHIGNKFYQIFPLCAGGELYEHVSQQGHFSEHDAALIMRDLVSALDYLHKQDILHMDIKPENILFKSKDSNSKIMLTDFGLAHNAKDVSVTGCKPTLEQLAKARKGFVEKGILCTRARGTIGYMCPELVLTGYMSPGTDVFAAGVVMFVLLSGRPPFADRSTRETLLNTVTGTYSMKGAVWESVSPEAIELVQKMLAWEPDARATTDEILEHVWIQQAELQATKSQQLERRQSKIMLNTDDAVVMDAVARYNATIQASAAAQVKPASKMAGDVTDTSPHLPAIASAGVAALMEEDSYDYYEDLSPPHSPVKQTAFPSSPPKMDSIKEHIRYSGEVEHGSSAEVSSTNSIDNNMEATELTPIDSKSADQSMQQQQQQCTPVAIVEEVVAAHHSSSRSTISIVSEAKANSTMAAAAAAAGSPVPITIPHLAFPTNNISASPGVAARDDMNDVITVNKTMSSATSILTDARRNTAAAEAASAAVSGAWAGKKGGNTTHLGVAMNRLAAHAKQLKTQKLVRGIVGLASSIQQVRDRASSLCARGERSMASKDNNYKEDDDDFVDEEAYRYFAGRGRAKTDVSIAPDVSSTWNSVLAKEYLVEPHRKFSPKHGLSQNPYDVLEATDEIQKALLGAFTHLGDESGHLTLEEFMCVLRYFGLIPDEVAPSTPHSPAAIDSYSNSTASGGVDKSGPGNMGLGGLLLCRLVESESDGTFSIDDLWKMQAMILQKHTLVVRTVFRIFQEAVWYPGRQTNFLAATEVLNAEHEVARSRSSSFAAGSGSGAGTSVASGTSPSEKGLAAAAAPLISNKETPPRSPRKEKDATDFCLSPSSAQRDRGDSASSYPSLTPRSSEHRSRAGSLDVVEPPPYITAKHVSAIFQRMGYPPQHGKLAFEALCKLLSRVKHKHEYATLRRRRHKSKHQLGSLYLATSGSRDPFDASSTAATVESSDGMRPSAASVSYSSCSTSDVEGADEDNDDNEDDEEEEDDDDSCDDFDEEDDVDDIDSGNNSLSDTSEKDIDFNYLEKGRSSQRVDCKKSPKSTKSSHKSLGGDTPPPAGFFKKTSVGDDDDDNDDGCNGTPSVKFKKTRSKRSKKEKLVAVATSAVQKLGSLISGKNDKEKTTSAESREAAAAKHSSTDPITPNNTPREWKMDVEDFVRAAKLDDILVQVVFARSPQKMAELVKKAKTKSPVKIKKIKKDMKSNNSQSTGISVFDPFAKASQKELTVNKLPPAFAGLKVNTMSISKPAAAAGGGGGAAGSDNLRARSGSSAAAAAPRDVTPRDLLMMSDSVDEADTEGNNGENTDEELIIIPRCTPNIRPGNKLSEMHTSIIAEELAPSILEEELRVAFKEMRERDKQHIKNKKDQYTSALFSNFLWPKK